MPTLRVRVGVTTKKELQAFANSAGADAKIRGRKNRLDGSITLYASTRKGTGLKDFLFGSTATSRELARQALKTILGSDAKRLPSSDSELRGSVLVGVAATKLKDLVSDPCYAAELQRFKDVLISGRNGLEHIDFLIGLHALRQHPSAKAAKQLQEKYLPVYEYDPTNFDLPAHEINVNDEYKKSALKALSEAISKNDLLGMCDAFEHAETQVMSGGEHGVLGTYFDRFVGILNRERVANATSTAK